MTITKENLLYVLKTQYDELKKNIELLENVQYAHQLYSPLRKVMSTAAIAYHNAEKGLSLVQQQQFCVVKLKKSYEMKISRSLKGVFAQFKVKYTDISDLVWKRKGYDPLNMVHVLSVPKGTLGILTSTYVTRSTHKMKIAIPNPVNGQIGHHGVLDVKPDDIDFDITQNEYDKMDPYRIALVSQRTKGSNFDAMKKLANTKGELK